MSSIAARGQQADRRPASIGSVAPAAAAAASRVRRVAVVIPLSDRPPHEGDEEQAIRHVLHYLPAYDRYMVAPRSLAYEHPDFRMIRLPDRFFGSLEAHTRMMLSPQFYRRFLDYEYILFHHLDALVLSPDLEAWCDLGYDFIGAPRIGPAGDRPRIVGNGGFALRRVRAFLDVLESDRYAVDPEVYWHRISSGRSAFSKLVRVPLRFLKRLHVFNSVQRQIDLEFESGAAFEDIFVTENATKYAPEFRIAPLDVALGFAFDEVPRTCFEMNGRRLPFGCHAWFKQDREFWEPHLLRD